MAAREPPLSEREEFAIYRLIEELKSSVKDFSPSDAYHNAEARFFHAYGHALAVVAVSVEI